MSNRYIHEDSQINTVKQEITKHSENYQAKISTHAEELASKLVGTGSIKLSLTEIFDSIREISHLVLMKHEK